jgi:hypothetical protein
MSNIELETHLPVEGLSGFVRDPSTRAIINMKNDVTELKSDMQAIKLLLQQIAEK